MATHSSLLAWKIPQTEEPGSLQSMGSQESRTRQQLSSCASKLALSINNLLPLTAFQSVCHKVNSKISCHHPTLHAKCQDLAKHSRW